jgi:hypothetical protein
MRIARVCWVAVALALFGRSATAQEATAEPAVKKSSLPHTHDGFYLQLSLGGGYAHDDLKYSSFLGGDITGTGEGASGMFDVRAGWSLKPGLIVGGGLFIEQVASPKVTIEGQDVSTDVSVGIFTLFGPLIDWYPSAGGGFHLGGALGAARLTMKNKQDEKLDNQPVGGGGIFFIGYDFWIGDEWSLGVELRSTGASMNDGDTNVRHTWGSGGILATLVYN